MKNMRNGWSEAGSGGAAPARPRHRQDCADVGSIDVDLETPAGGAGPGPPRLRAPAMRSRPGPLRGLPGWRPASSHPLAPSGLVTAAGALGLLALAPPGCTELS